jgi:hypothetical protein
MLRCKRATCAWNIDCYEKSNYHPLNLLYSVASSVDVTAELSEISYKLLPETSLRYYLLYFRRSYSVNNLEISDMLFRNYFFSFVVELLAALYVNVRLNLWPEGSFLPRDQLHKCRVSQHRTHHRCLHILQNGTSS